MTLVNRIAAALLFLLLMPLGASAQDLQIPPANYPHLIELGKSAQDFVPVGWKLELSATGDLNKDGVDDIAMVLRQDSAANRIVNESLGENPFDTNPRILAAAFGSADGFSLVVQDHTLIARRESPTLDDPLAEGGLEIDNGSIVVKLGMFASAGSWETFNSTFRFRHDGEIFRLIGYDKVWTHRGSGELIATSVNYITGLAEISKGTIATDVYSSTAKRRIGRKALLTIEQVGDGLAFEPFPASQ